MLQAAYESKSSDLPSSFETTPIKGFQFNGSTDGSISQDVNQFQGAVCFSVPLLSVPGRSGLNLDLTAVYNSSVSDEVMQSNRDVPTGVLGLGWSLMVDRIDANYATAGNRNSATFSLVHHGTRNRLFYTSRRWQRGNLPASFSTILDQRQINPDLLTAFLAQTLVVDASSQVTVVAADQQWTITDPVNEYLLDIAVNPNDSTKLIIFDGGDSYEPESFDFSRVQYYAPFERWEVYSTNGLCAVYGGGWAVDTVGNAVSRGNSIAVSVRWGNWSGPSKIVRNDQEQIAHSVFPVSWHISSERSFNRDEILYSYQQVSQAVGNNGLNYTKAIYLAQITDMFGRTVSFHYADKIFNPNPQDQREYLDPYKPVPDNIPNAYQSCYETKYLASVVYKNQAGQVLQTTILEYDVDLYCPIPGNAPPTWAGDRCKRTLTTVTNTNHLGVGLPPIRFTYQPLGNVNAGALASKVLPEGAVVLYEYQKMSLSACSRSITITPPLSSAVPKIWFGPNYAVLLWIASDRFTLTTYTWSGRWIEWQPAESKYRFSCNPEDITANVEEDFFVLSMGSANATQTIVVCLHQNNRILGGWIEPENMPVILDTIDRTIASGDKFFAIGNAYDNSGSLYTWSNPLHQWQNQQFPPPQSVSNPAQFALFLSGAANLLTTLYYDRLSSPGQKQSQLTLSEINEDGMWSRAAQRTANEITVTGSTYAQLQQNLHWTGSAWVFAATAVTQDNNSNQVYQVLLYTWQSAQQNPARWNDPFVLDANIPKSASGSPAFAATAVVQPSGLVASGPNLLRYNGVEWLVNQNLQLQLPAVDDTFFWFAQGPDIVLKSENSENLIIGMAQVFDPNLETSNWSESPIMIYNSPPVGDRLAGYFPTAGQDFVSYNDSFYYRGVSSDWGDPFLSPISGLPPGSNTTTLINESPCFMVYLQQNEGNPVQTNMLLLNAGFVDGTETVFQNFFRPIEPNGQTAPNADGKYPAGVDTFATYLPLNATFDQAQSITLYRFLNDSITQPVTDYPVQFVTVNGGYQEKAYKYTFDNATATVNPQGYTCKYYQSTVQVGDGSLCGSTQFTFINGIGGVLPGNPALDAALDGQLSKKEYFDALGSPVSSQENHWQTIDTVEDLWSRAEVPLNGVYVQLDHSINTVNGVTNRQDFVYDAATCQPVTTTTQVWNGLSQQETHIKSVDAGYVDYPQLGWLNILDQQTGSSYQVAVGNNPAVLTAQQKMQMNQSPGINCDAGGNLQIPCAHITLGRKEPGMGSPQSAPSQWLRQSTVTANNAWGYPEVVLDAGLVATSTLYAAAGSPIVAVFDGISINQHEGYYYGFEPYETAGKWALQLNQTPITDTICCTGTQSLCVPAGVTGATLELTPVNRARKYLFGCWATLDPAAGTPPAAVAWKIDYVSSTTQPLPTPQTITVSGTEWRYYAVVIDLSSTTDPVTVRFTAVNTGLAKLYLDNVSFASIDAGAKATIYDPLSFVVTAEVGPYNQIRRNIYDAAERKIGTTSESETVINVIAPYLSRQNNPSFNAASPNSQLVFQPMGETYYARFRNQGVWSNHFASAQQLNWISDRGELRYTGSTAGSIALTNPQLSINYALRLRSQMNGSALSSCGLAVGRELQIQWQPGSGVWTLSDTRNGITLNSTTTNSNPSGDWMLILGQSAVLFAVNGQVIFDYLPVAMPSGAPAILASGAFAIRDLVVGGEPQIAIKYFDGTSQALQSQSIENTQAVVTATVYDAVARPVVQVKPVIYTGTVGQSGSLLSYRNDVVSSFDWSTGVLTGKAANDYPADQGYPYVRQMLENSPLCRLVQKGLPGKDFAILGTDPAQQHTARTAYGSNDNTTINAALGLPANSYATITNTDPDGRVSVQLHNSIGLSIATATCLNIEQQQWIYNLGYTTFTNSGSEKIVRLPNYYAPPAGSTGAAFVNQNTRDLIGLVQSMTTPDAGTVNSIANHRGQTRFTQNALAAALDLILFAKFDEYGRLIEGGLVPAAWNEQQLLQLANTPTWPTAQDGARVVRSYSYGQDPTQPSSLGRLVLTRNYDEATQQLTTTNTYVYDANGRTAVYRIEFADGTSHSTAYTYDNLGNSATTIYDSGYQVSIKRDSVGRVQQLSDDSGQVLANYAYNPDDQISQQTLLPGSLGSVLINYQYNPAGWLSQSGSPQMTETISYVSGSFNQQPLYSGRIGACQTSFADLAQPAGTFPPALSFAYEYDQRGQLLVAQASAGGTVQPQWSFGVADLTTFDANGNIVAVNEGGESENYKYKSNTNQVLNTDGSEQTEFVSNAIGAVTSASPRSITRIDYQLVTQQAEQIETSANGNLSFVYDSRSNRVRKVSNTATRTYVRGMNGWPLVEYNKSDSATQQITEYLYGPRGIIALRQDGQIMPLLTDHLSSVRALLNVNGQVQAAFHYAPFGEVLVEFGDGTPLRYRFTGYEFDAETGLYNAAARMYDPNLRRFYSTDPQMQFYSPYLYAGNNPISVLDPTGESAWWAILVGAVVGIIATVATGGALAPAVAGLEGAAAVAVGAGVAATAGAIGTIAGDATTAGLSGEKFTAMRALVDIAGGATGGAVGAVAGGAAASLAMRGLLAASEEIAPSIVTTIGHITAGVVGGTAGATAQSAVTSAMTGQSFFSTGTMVNTLFGGVAGFGGSLLGSGAHLGWGGDMPVPLGRNDFGLIDRSVVSSGAADGRRFVTFNSEDIGHYRENIHHINPTNAARYDVIDVHGSPGTVFITVHTPGGRSYMRPMSGSLFGDYVVQSGWSIGNTPIKLSICSAGRSGWFTRSVGQSLATALGRNTLGSRGTVGMITGAPTNTWVRFA